MVTQKDRDATRPYGEYPLTLNIQPLNTLISPSRELPLLAKQDRFTGTFRQG